MSEVNPSTEPDLSWLDGDDWALAASPSRMLIDQKIEAGDFWVGEMPDQPDPQQAAPAPGTDDETEHDAFPTVITGKDGRVVAFWP